MDIEHTLQTALTLHRGGDIESATKLYRAVLDVEPAHPTASLNLAGLAIDNDRFDEAQGLLQTVLARDEDSGIAHLLYSRLCFLRGDHEQGYPHIRSAFELLPDEEGVAAEFVSAMRRRYYTFEQDEYLALFEQAQQNRLPEDRLQRLAHHTFLRIARPELIKLLVEPGLPQETPDAVTRWLEVLPEEAQAELAVLARNFGQALMLMHDAPRYAPPPATLTLRAGEDSPEEIRQVETLEDCDSLIGATLEVVHDGELKFLPFTEIKSIEFAAPGAVTGVFVTMRDGAVLSGLMPLFYLFTEFADSDKVRQGQSTLIRPVLAEAAVGVGLRALRADGKPVPVVGIERIDFEDSP